MTSTVPPAARASRWAPWDGMPRRDDLLCWYALAGMAVFSSAMWPLRPILIGSNPVLLEFLTGSKESIIAAGRSPRSGRFRPCSRCWRRSSG